MNCQLCNEYIDEDQILFGDALKMEDEIWHTECFREYFGDAVLAKIQ